MTKTIYTSIILMLLMLTATPCLRAQQTTQATQQALVINEIMQSNIDCIMDDKKEFPDSWVELYNNSDGAIQLKGYRLGITTVADDAYQLPSRNIQPRGRLLVYCDREKTGLHTDFRLESGKGCNVYLFKGETVADSLPAPLKKMPAPNIAYGRETDGGSLWGYQLKASPGEKNDGGICDHDHVLGDVVFSEKGRATAGPLRLQLTLSLPQGSPEGTEIRYTTDGKEPTATSRLYTAPINIARSTVVRARLFCEGWLSPVSTAESYISHGREITLPVVSIAIDKDYLDDAKIGIYANNNGSKRNDWRRPMNIEFFFNPEADSDLNQLCETRIAGGATRSAALKTMAIYAHKRFGTKRFDYEFFPDQKPGLTDFKSLLLRNAGNDFDYLYMRDAIIQRTMVRHTDLDWQAWQPAIVYINGTYRGMLNIRERSNEDNIYTNYGGLEDIDMVENWDQLKAGTWDNYNAFKAFYKQHGHTRAEFEQWMDCSVFMDLMITNLYFCNLDFPGNNIVMWRPRTEDGRWRWLIKDTDFGLGLYDRDVEYNIVEWIYNPNYDKDNSWGNLSAATQLFRRLMDDDDFRREFIDRCYIYMGDFMNDQGVSEVWDPMYEMIKAEYPHHRALFNRWWPNYTTELENAHAWLRRRTPVFSRHLAEYYDLGKPVTMTVNTALKNAAEGHFRFNGVSLSKGTFNGHFLTGRHITLEPGEESTLNVTGWRTVVNGASQEHPGARLEMDVPECNSLIVSALLDGETSISTLRTDTGSHDVYDLSGRKVRTGTTSLEGLPSGIYIVGGRKVVK